MLMDLCEQSPSYVRSIAPYHPGKPISELAREMGLEERNIVKLASNENPRGIGPRTRAAVPAKKFGHDLEAMAKAIDDETYVAWIANPNNPTRTFVRHEEIEAFLKRVPERVLVVLDEAYNEYLPAELRGDSVK